MSDPVECYSGFSFGERPRAFEWQGQRLQVVEVIARWRTPDGWGFRVRASVGQVFELLYCEQKNEWQVSQPINLNIHPQPSKEPP